MLPHRKFCARHTAEMCFTRTHLPTCYIHLQPNYSLIEIEKFRKTKPGREPMAKVRHYNLDIKYAGEYLARPLPSGGLDIIYNQDIVDGAMLSDQADFNYHDHQFEISKTIYFDHHISRVRKVPCALESDTKAFIGDVRLLTDKGFSHKRTYHTVLGGDFFNPVFMDGELIGYAICEKLAGYDAVSGLLHPDDGFYEEMILRYTDKTTKTVDGIMFAGSQNDNCCNIEEAIIFDVHYCMDCRMFNTKI